MEIPKDILARARAALDRGDNFAAYDIASQAGGSRELTYVRVLALARLGDWRTALAQYVEAGLDQAGDVDSLALKARLLKDKAFDSDSAARGPILREARDAYQAAFEATGENFGAINAASLSFMIGDRPAAEQLSRTILDGSPSGDFASYWQGAIHAEALAIMGRFDEARATLAEAARLPDASVAARSSTFRQFRRLFAHVEIAPTTAAALLDPIRPPRVAHFCGSMFVADDAREARIAAEVAAALREENVGMAFGALACGADIVIAEQALALGIELHVVFPFDRDDFVRQSVAIGGEEWIARFERCAAAATGVYAASAMPFVNDDAQFAFGSGTAMGMARLRAAQIDAETVQIAVTDDKRARGVAGTAADIAAWRAAGGRTRRLLAMGARRPDHQKSDSAGNSERTRRALRVLLFADFQGFSRLPEPVIPKFWRTVMATSAEVLAPYAGTIRASNTWGDGLHIVFDSVEAAAPALIELRERLSALDLGDLGAADVTGMRIAAHFGSVYEMVDPVTGRQNFYGTEVSRAARLEPATPPGRVYITEPMAAAIEMACADLFAPRYVGRLSLPKNFGTEPIYSLERRRPADAPPLSPRREME